MNKVTIFNFNTAEVRTITKDDKVWFVASDIAAILGYRDATNMTRILDEDEAGTHIMSIRSDNGVEQNREVSIISEPGLYHACFSSTKPEAKSLRRWVTHDVLPSIRKHGFYETEEYKQMKTMLRNAVDDALHGPIAKRLELKLLLAQEVAERAKASTERIKARSDARLLDMQAQIHALSERVRKLEEGGRDNEKEFEKMRKGKYGVMDFKYLH